LEHCQDLKTLLSVGDDCDVNYCELFEDLKVLSSVIPSRISDIREIFKFTVQRKLSEVYSNVFILLRIIMIVPVTTHPLKEAFRR
jgi:hypothetical protein